MNMHVLVIGQIWLQDVRKQKGGKNLCVSCMDQISIKTPNPKCRLHWCLIKLIDWRYSQSCWYFRPLFWTCVNKYRGMYSYSVLQGRRSGTSDRWTPVAKYLYWSILKKSRQLGFGVVIDIWSRICCKRFQDFILYILLAAHSFAYAAHFWFLRDVWIWTQSAAVASWRATDLATHPNKTCLKNVDGPLEDLHPGKDVLQPPRLVQDLSGTIYRRQGLVSCRRVKGQ